MENGGSAVGAVAPVVQGIKEDRRNRLLKIHHGRIEEFILEDWKNGRITGEAGDYDAACASRLNSSGMIGRKVNQLHVRYIRVNHLHIMTNRAGRWHRKWERADKTAARVFKHKPLPKLRGKVDRAGQIRLIDDMITRLTGLKATL